MTMESSEPDETCPHVLFNAGQQCCAMQSSCTKTHKQDGGLDSELLMAVQNGDQRAVEFALANQANPDSQDKFGYSSLIFAAAAGDFELVRLLIQHGADLQICDNENRTALSWAQEGNHTNIVKLLQTSQRDRELFAAVHKTDFVAVQSALKKRANPNVCDEHGNTPLIIAASLGDDAIVRLLLEYDANPDNVNLETQTALIWAASEGHATVVNLLTPEGTDTAVNLHRDSGGNTPLHFAAANGHFEIVKHLIRCGFPVDIQNDTGHTAIGLACRNPGILHTLRAQTVSLLVEKQCSVNLGDKNGLTPLMRAAAASLNLVVKLLIENKADINAQARTGDTALTMATKHTIRRGDGASVGTMRALIDAGCNVNATGNGSSPPLHWAVSETPQATPVVILLLASNADVNQYGHTKLTPLTLAVSRGDHHTARLLVNHGADINAATVNGISALDMAKTKDTVMTQILTGGRTNTTWMSGATSDTHTCPHSPIRPVETDQSGTTKGKKDGRPTRNTTKNGC